MRAARFLLVWLLRAPLLLAASGPHTWGVRPNGSPITELAPPGSRALLLFFVASDCPVSNRTFPEMRRVREEFAGHGVQVWFVYPNQGEEAAGVREHQRQFDPGGEALLDQKGVLVRLAGAVATPEAVVLTPDSATGWRPLYAGRVDDRYVRLGLERPAATQHFAEQATQAVLDGRTPKPAIGQPVGCAIVNPEIR